MNNSLFFDHDPISSAKQAKKEIPQPPETKDVAIFLHKNGIQPKEIASKSVTPKEDILPVADKIFGGF